MVKHVFGWHAVMRLIEQADKKIEKLLVAEDRKDSRAESLLKLASDKGIPVARVKKHELDFEVQGKHQGVIAYVSQSTQLAEKKDLFEFVSNLDHLPFILILDQVKDPHNLGACLRSAEAAGVDAVIVPERRAVGITPVVSKIACGAAETMPFYQVTNLSRTIEQLQKLDIRIIGAAEQASSELFDSDLTGSIALVMGAEDKGLRRLTREKCDEIISIPTMGKISSLNVSVAAGVCLFEAVRQRNFSI